MGMETLIPTIVTGGVVLKFSEAAFDGGRRADRTKPRRRTGGRLVDKYPTYPSEYRPF
jgi:hypothetical protein